MLNPRAAPTLEVIMRVFVSYAPADRALAEQVARQLSDAGLEVWFDPDVSGAQEWWQRSLDAVGAADAFVTMWTSNLAPAAAATALLHHAGALGKPVLAVQSGPVDHPPATDDLSFGLIDFGDPALPQTVGALVQHDDWVPPAYAVPLQQPPAVAPQPTYPPPGYPGYPAYPPAQRKSSAGLIGGLCAVAVLVIAALVAGVVLLVRSDGATTASDSPGQDADGAGVRVVDDGILVGSSTAPVVIDVFNDAMCPACGEFIATYGPEIRDALLDNKIQVHYHLINMLDVYSASGDYSTRAAAAAYCVAADVDVATFEDFYSALFDPAFQPEEGGTSDHTDDDLAEMAVEAGAPESAAECIAGGDDADRAARRTDEAYATLEDLGGEAVPAVYESGVEVDIQDPGWVTTLTR